MEPEQIAAVFAGRPIDEPGPCPWAYPLDINTYKEAGEHFLTPDYPMPSAPIPYEARQQEIIVVSDLHIASGRNRNGVFRGTENFFADDAFARFLDHMLCNKASGSQLLVFNGDIFDFLRVTEYPGWRRRVSFTRRLKLFFKGYKPVEPRRPDPSEINDEFTEWSAELAKIGILRSPLSLKQSISATEKNYGLETDDYKTIYRLIRIRQGHPSFFIALARWLLSGNAILIQKGNHDLELCQDKTRNYIELLLAEASLALSPEEGLEAILKNRIFPLVRFADDAVLINKELYLEHGHRYDKFTMVLDGGFLPGKGTQINIPFGSFFNRYLINRVELFYPYFDKVRPSGNIIPMLVRDNFPLALKIILKQIPFTLRILRTNRRYVWFMLHRVFWLALAIFVPLLGLLILDGKQIINHLAASPNKDVDLLASVLTKIAENVGVMVLSYGLARLIAWFQLTEPDSLYKFAIWREEQSPGKFRIMTMGHTHNPGEYALENGTMFYNTGTWIPIIETSSATVREDRTYTFLHLKKDESEKLQPVGFLQRWNDDAQRVDPVLLIERK
jgi:UDP-2,3-diacylglucosamine pyrophosphatase LpxH